MANLYRPASTLLINMGGSYKLVVRITTTTSEKVVKKTPDGTPPTGGTLNVFYETTAGASDSNYEDEHFFSNPEGGTFIVNSSNKVVATGITYRKRDSSAEAEPVLEF